MNEIVSRWSKKSLSQIFTILTGVVLAVSLINQYTIINIDLDFFNFLSIDNVNPTEKEMNVLTFLLTSNILLEVIHTIIRLVVSKLFANHNSSDEYKENEMYTRYLTIRDILELISSISGLLLVFILKYADINYILSPIIYIIIVARIFSAIYAHFYYKNLSLVNKVSQVKK